MKARELYRAGKLTEAVAAMNDEVKANPSDVEQRSFLAELLCIAGNLERADVQLEAIEKLQPGLGPTLALLRQLVRAEKTRQEVHGAGRAPEFLAPAPEHVQLTLRAVAAARAGDAAETTRLVAAAEEARPAVGGTCDGVAFDDMRDLDDLTGGVFEVLTSTGKHVWIPLEHVVSVELDAPVRPLDLLWRPAQLSVREGPEGKVYLPAVYAPVVGAEPLDDAARLGRRTDWIPAGSDGALRGVGLRTFIVGDEPRTLLELGTLSFGG
jgi:type VI secretion system protein ImpE